MRRPKGAQHVGTSPVQAETDVHASTRYEKGQVKPGQRRYELGEKMPGQPVKGQPIKRYTVQETQEQLQLVEQALIQGLTEREIRVALAKRKHFVGQARVKILKARVHEQMKLEGERTRPMTREKQLRRLYAELSDARGTKDAKGAWITKPHWSAITRLEMLIAQVEGNFEPIVIDIDVVHREALTNVLTSITPEQAAQMVASYDKLATLAEAAAHARGEKMPALLPAPEKNVIPTFVMGGTR